MVKGERKQQRQVGESAHVKHLGVLPLVKFKIIQGKKEIEPWKGEAASILEWMRNSSAMLGHVREETGMFWKVEKDSPIYFEDSMVGGDMKMDIAFFSSDKDGQHYNIAERLVPRSIKPGDRVKLSIMGCCSIIDIRKA